MKLFNLQSSALSKKFNVPLTILILLIGFLLLSSPAKRVFAEEFSGIQSSATQQAEPASEPTPDSTPETLSETNTEVTVEVPVETVTPTEDVTPNPEVVDDSSTPDVTETNISSAPQIDSTPTVDEQMTENGKLVVVSATPEQELIHEYTNVPVKTEISEIFKIGQEDQIKIKWQNNNGQEMQFVSYDDDTDGLIDHVSWVVPHLSVQTFEIIFISNALQLDADKNTLADIYDLVNTRDQNFASLQDGQFVRVTFEKLLDSTKDITIYAKATNENSPATIEVYTLDGQLLATFENIILDGKYKIFLTSLLSETDTFDLKIIGNVEIDYIVDPPATAYWVGGTGNWSDAANHWATSSGGTPGAGNAPDATSNVIFDASSGAASTIVTIDTAATVGSITISGYTGTITQSANVTITNSGGQSGNYSQTSAVTWTTPNPGTDTFSATGSFSITAGTFRRYTGTGISTDPFIIFDVYGLQAMKTNLANSYKLNGNINASVTSGWNAGEGFVPVGTNTTNFTGNFDGAGFAISDLYINSTTLSYVGLFGYTLGSIQNLTLTNASISGIGIAGANGSDGAAGTSGATPTAGGTGTAGTAGSILYIGGLAGYNAGTITNVSISGTVTGTGGTGGNSGNAGAGGNTTSGATVAGAGGTSLAGGAGAVVYSGGLIGYSAQGSINNSSSSAIVTGTGGTGGNSGNGGAGGTNSGSGIGGAGGGAGASGIGGISYVGGLIGWVNSGIVVTSFATGNVTATGGTGGSVVLQEKFKIKFKFKKRKKKIFFFIGFPFLIIK